MINRNSLFILITLFMFFAASCSTKNSTENKNLSQIQKENSQNSNNAIHANYANFNGFDISEDNVNFKINGKTLDLKLPVYLDKNRYYISLNEFTEQLNGKIEKNDNILDIEINDKLYSINLLNNNVTCPNNNFCLKKSLLNKNDIYYIGFSDFSHMLNLYTRWDKDNKIINCKIEGYNNLNLPKYKSKIKQIGFIRMEDIGTNSQPYAKEYFEKLRIITDYMYQKKIPYHIAWIPRYEIPNQGIDNNPLTKNNFEIAEMVYSLDYFNAHDGIIGLHGYTHQCENDESGTGFEFGKFEPSTEVFKEKIKKAIETASYLDIPINFFEAPHYEITPEQNKIAEKYFKILYYPFNDYGEDKVDLTKPQLSPYNKSSYYISTPLDYIPINKEDVTLGKIKNADINKMGSIFFHPALENKYISLTEDSNGIPTFTYDSNSTLKKLLGILEEKGFKIIKVTDI